MSRQFCRMHGFARDGRRPHTLRMTIDAILHRQRLERPGRRPLKGFHRTVAGLTFDLRCRHVNLMRKEDLRRQAPDPLPRNVLSFFSVRQEFFDLRVVGISARVTTEAQCRWRSPRNRIFFHSLMARRTRETECNVSLMRKRNRLFDAGENAARPVTHGRHGRRNYQDQNNSFHCHPLLLAIGTHVASLHKRVLDIMPQYQTFPLPTAAPWKTTAGPICGIPANATFSTDEWQPSHGKPLLDMRLVTELNGLDHRRRLTACRQCSSRPSSASTRVTWRRIPSRIRRDPESARL
jgi:hypothetical protein